MKNMHDPNDIEALGHAARGGNRDALEKLCHHLRVSFVLLAKRRIGNQETAEDLAHDALAIITERIADLGADTIIVPWCHAVLRNVIGNYYMSQRRSERLLPWARGLIERWHGSISPEEENARKEIRRVFPELPERCQQLIRWKMAGLTADEMQERLRLPNKNALYMRLHRCRNELKRLLLEEDAE